VTGFKRSPLCPGKAVRYAVARVTQIEAFPVGWRPGDDGPFDATPAIARGLAALDDAALLVRYEAMGAWQLAGLGTMFDEVCDVTSVTSVGAGTFGHIRSSYGRGSGPTDGG